MTASDQSVADRGGARIGACTRLSQGIPWPWVDGGATGHSARACDSEFRQRLIGARVVRQACFDGRASVLWAVDRQLAVGRFDAVAEAAEPGAGLVGAAVAVVGDTDLQLA